MSYEIIGDTETLTKDQWLEIRRSGLGGSDLGAIMGLSKYRTPLAVYLDKLGQAPPVEESEPMYWGNVLEEVVAQEFSKRTGKAVKKYPHMLRSKQYPFMLANVDRMLVDEVAGLECKTAHANKAKEWEDGQVPQDYLCQVYHYMIVTGIHKWYIACLVGGQKFFWYEIVYDEAIAAKLIADESDFWNNFVVPQVPPAMIGGDVDMLTSLFNDPADTTVILDEAALPLVQEYQSLSVVEKMAGKSKDEAKVKLCSLIGNNTKAICGGYRIGWAPVSTTRLDSDRIKKEAPELFTKYSKVTESRRLTIKGE